LERYYRKAAELGVNFVRYSPSEPPSVIIGKRIEVRVHDLTADHELHIPADLVVLSQTLAPNPDNHRLSEALKLSLGQDGFFLEAHPKMRPVEFATDGIFLAGTAQGPKGFMESMTQGLAAASRALIPLMKGKVVQEPTTANVDQDLCTGCARCVMVCPYNAIEMTGSEGGILAEVNQLMCKGCGKCAVACPVRAISIFNFTTDQMLVQIDEALAEVKEGEVRGIAMLCNWCAYAGADNAGVSRYQYPPNLIPIRIMCTGRVDPFYILYALLKGADGVLIGGCHPGDCHYMSGNTMMEGSVRNLREMIAEYGFDPSRVRVEWCSASEGKRFAQIIKDFTEQMVRLGPNPNRIKGDEAIPVFVGKGVA
jgi:heterodisulfide reductase subunit A